MTVLRVEIELICGEGHAVSAIVDVEVERVGLDRTFIGYCNSGMLLKRHGEEAIQGLVGSNLQGDRLVQVIVAKSQAEEVANRSLNMGERAFAVPVHAEDQRLEMIGIVAGRL